MSDPSGGKVGAMLRADVAALTRARGAVTEEREDPDAPTPGRWYWVREADDKERWLGCVTRLGSNYAELTAATGGHARVLYTEFNNVCYAEPDAAAYIEKQIQAHHRETRRLVGDIQAVTERLALKPSSLGEGNETQALALRSGNQPTEEYKAALVKAKEEDLPTLFKAIEEENRAMAKWMEAQLLPLQAQVAPMKELITAIEARVFNVELYAGLTENAAKIKDGKPAAVGEPVHLFQRRHYMDEECLAAYEAGGMTFKNIHAFDKWLLRPENFNRILPFPRCIVAFRVRRNEAQHEFASWQELISFVLSGEGQGQMDKKTFLYIRNGEQLHWLETSIDFGAKLFPDQDQSNLSGKLYANTGNGSRPTRVITEGEWLSMIADEKKAEARTKVAYEEALVKYRAEKKEYPAKLRAYGAAMRKFKAERKAWDTAYEAWKKKAWTDIPYDAAGQERIERRRNHDMPDFTLERPQHEPQKPCAPHSPWSHDYYSGSDTSASFTPFTKDNVYYDEITAKVKADIDAHNRLVLVLQGLLDRSMTLHPHPQWRLWEPASFEAALRLVYDDSRALVPGPKPDFSGYRTRCNTSIKPGSVTIGQERFWEEREAEKLNAHERQREHGRNHYDRKTYRPRGDPGPGKFAKAVRVRGGKVTFEWEVEKTKEWWGTSDTFRVPGKSGLWTRKVRHETTRKVRKRLVVPVERLFNVSAYTPGDFKPFFADPRTRADYLRWAWLLLEAEEFHAGNRKVSAQGREGSEPPMGDADEGAQDESEDDDG